MSQKYRLIQFACVRLLASLLPSAFAQNFKEKAHPLKSVANLDAFVTAAANKKLVMLGEFTLGTHEFYTLRDVISKAATPHVLITAPIVSATSALIKSPV